MVGLVLVSHSQELAKALVDLVKQIAPQDIQITMSAGVGPTHQEFGTDAIEIAKAIQSVYSSDGVLVLMDIGSAVLSADMALELIPLEMRGKVTLCSAPLVEGAISAGVQASLGSDLETVCREAQSALIPKVEHLGESMPIAEIDENTLDLPDQAKVHTITVQLQNLHGLHARPAARFVQVAVTYQADIRVTNASSGKGPASAKSLNALATLGASRGDLLTITANGNQALPALEALRRLIQDNFGGGESEGDAS